MKVFKGTNRDMTCTKGKGSFKYEIGKKYSEEECKTRRCGLHVSEYVMETLSWYSPASGGRIFQAVADEVDEENGDVMCCKELTLVRELKIKDICYEALVYMLEHPQREYKAKGAGYEVAKDKAEVPNGIAIARGADPRVKAGKGSVIGLVVEDKEGITGITMAVVGQRNVKPGKWYRMGKDGMEEYEKHTRRESAKA